MWYGIENISDIWANITELFQAYMGTGLIVIGFFVALIYLLITEKRKPIRIMFVYMPIFLLFVFFNPFLIGILKQYTGEEIYYRILWLIPVTMVLAFVITEVYGTLQGRKKTVFAIAAAAGVMVSGSYIYHNGFFERAENFYHMPQSVVEICDAIEYEGREVMAVFPEELLQYVRQYSPTVCMPYGRELIVESWNYAPTPLYEAMEAEEISAEELIKLAREEMCVYIILPSDKKVKGDFEDYEFETFGQTQGYIIYKDSTVDLSY